MPGQHLTAHLIEIALDRSKALAVELERIRQRQYPPSGPDRLIKLAISANSRTDKSLSQRLRGSSGLPSTPDRRNEIFLRGKTSLLSFLHLLMLCVEGAEIQNSPSAFVVPIRSMLERQLKHQNNQDFDFIVKSSRAYNYMIWTIHDEMKKIFLEAGYSNLLRDIPKRFFVIECPISEKRNIPIHCIFAHEVGHVWYQTSQLPSALLPMALSVQDDMDIKITKANWIEELAADAIALCLIGPAYLFSFIYFAGPFCSMSNSSKTHPPDNMRISFMTDMLLKRQQEGLGYESAISSSSSNLSYVKQWQQYARGSVGTLPRTPIVQRVNSIMPEIMRQTKLLTKGRRYTPTAYKRDIPSLGENISTGIPPNETISAGGIVKPARAESILNAGWSYLISGDLSYSRLLGIKDRWRVTNRLFDLVSKGLEYSEMQRRWSHQR